MTLVKWKPRTELTNSFDQMFNHFFDNDYGVSLNHWAPSVDVEENDKIFSLHADIPGLSKKDVSLEIHDGVLSIKGERKDKSEIENDTFHVRERQSGAFCRSFRLPENVEEDKINAKFKNGVLTIELPKSEIVQPETRTIKIS
ncbi:MAG: Hsp20/alpha crystallin family protein [Candidatus Marinimicrobia bacterium]|jgi:HSP20 family protein|nr:Hsp20/alpha crystallin family protein [Candidatus Neomarinimicrobiota bacterium]MBT3496309.1 Hsp20/alpha crystallin family protein [Candidatus Neomarinimicrobiota bacterium]MBT3691967.1 Hsp20/alpha crystallin family protein [Candidatus Neomarinimicrobiota bacterium]MBT3732232.1 Hsp20/alpha crystallin family protein [Candidatus Neomarinimicrobiota bacterium]MBT4144521.1 Hsp20/alpha crystallin family protein [Candidatus Neomarinimicrobiota bacterium]